MPVLCRYLCTLLREWWPEERETRIRWLRELVKREESCGEVVELVELGISEGEWRKV